MNHSLVSWEITLLYFFTWNCTWFGQKELIKVQNFRLLTAHIKFHQICTLIGSLMLKVYKILATKYRGVMPHDPEDWCQIWRKTDLFFQKWQQFGEIWLEHSKVSKTCTFICSYCAKYLIFDLKKFRGVIFHDTEGWCKVWKMTWGIWQSFTRALESLKIGTWMGSFYPKQKMHELKIYRGVMCHDNDEWCKIWRGIDLSFQNWHEEVNKFWPEHLKNSKIFIFMCSFWAKFILFELKNTEELSFMTLKRDRKFGEESTCRFKIDKRNLTDFDLSTQKSQKFSL